VPAARILNGEFTPNGEAGKYNVIRPGSYRGFEEFRMVSRLIVTGILFAILTSGCKQPAKDEELDAVVDRAGGRSTTLASASLPRLERPISSLIGDALGVGGGFVVGASRDRVADDPKNRDAVIKASNRAKVQPAKSEQVLSGRSADLNTDGYVTVDEVVALKQANLSDTEIVDRLRLTGQVFELSDFQEDYLRARRVSDVVIRAIRHTL
jgi:hypothetical protein